MKIFKTALLHDDKKAVKELLKQTEECVKVNKLQQAIKIKYKLYKKPPAPPPTTSYFSNI
jgi:uncharacterized membrane protein YvbJ